MPPLVISQIALAFAWIVAGFAGCGWYSSARQRRSLMNERVLLRTRLGDMDRENTRLRKLLTDEQIDWRDDRKLTRIWRPEQ